ncbi:MAG: C39 family peptidase [Silvanigrellaceae bacterium]|nr:C39 family peptidase [Silvanigrellaceae bacterium]
MMKIKSVLFLLVSLFPFQVFSIPPLISSGKSPVCLMLQGVAPQEDGWSCGPNMATRVLNFYGIDESLDVIKQNAPLSLNLGFEDTRVGPSPTQLAAYMTRIAHAAGRFDLNFIVKENATLEDIQRVVEENQEPVLILTLEGTNGFDLPIIGEVLSIPLLHYLTISGFDRNRNIVHVIDTNDQIYHYPYFAISQKWHWQLGAQSPSQRIIKRVLDYLKIQGGLMIVNASAF